MNKSKVATESQTILLGQHSVFEMLVDQHADLVFSIKDQAGRYVALSEACVRRCGLKHKYEALGKTVHDLLPSDLAIRYQQQDDYVLRTGKPIATQLELTLFPDGQRGWCVSSKFPLRDAQQQIIGLASLTKDLIEPSSEPFIDDKFAATVQFLQQHFDRTLTLETLAQRAELSPAQFDRRMRRIFHLSTAQYLIKLRIDAACRMLASTEIAIAEIARACGYCDQSAMTRQLQQVTGMTPRAFRKWIREFSPSRK